MTHLHCTLRAIHTLEAHHLSGFCFLLLFFSMVIVFLIVDSHFSKATAAGPESGMRGLRGRPFDIQGGGGGLVVSGGKKLFISNLSGGKKWFFILSVMDYT